MCLPGLISSMTTALTTILATRPCPVPSAAAVGKVAISL